MILKISYVKSKLETVIAFSEAPFGAEVNKTFYAVFRL